MGKLNNGDAGSGPPVSELEGAGLELNDMRNFKKKYFYFFLDKKVTKNQACMKKA
jgi:hypothetical protein